jgi:CHAT domain-containing protein
VKADTGTLKSLLAKMPGTVALYTLVGSTRYQVIVITGSVTIAREYPIGEKALNQKIAAFEEKLRDPSQDPRPAAKELYDILVGPIEKDLEQAHARTLVWALSGALRYVPVAALYDGKQYLVERFGTANITSGNLANLREKPNAAWMQIVAMGISRKYDGMPEDSLPALPRVAGELYDIVKDPQIKDSHGVLPGAILLDNQFTERALEDAFSHPQPIVHIASHFVFHPGDGQKSYLLLAGKESAGTGYPLTLADFSANPNLEMADTELLTLSACETGLTGSARNGIEVDGLGTTAQLKGAKAVISSLWEVDDSSTGELMADFYRRWAGGNLAKVEALRQAQVSLLEGRILPKPDLANPSAPANFAHPYYWAPFILMGNWQ